jgi:hypothetical protein
MIIAILIVVYSIYGGKRLGFMASYMDGYRADVKMIMDAFARIPRINERDRGWLQYREILSKRIAKRLNMSSLYEAEDKVDAMIANIVANKDKPMTEPYEILNYIEFDKSRDYDMLLKNIINPYVEPAKLVDTTNALKNLSILDKYNPMDVAENRFKRIKALLIVASFVAAYAWLRLLIHYKLLAIAILAIIILITTGMYMSY